MADAPRMDHKQLRRSKKLIRKLCCNYDHGNCLALDGTIYIRIFAHSDLQMDVVTR